MYYFEVKLNDEPGAHYAMRYSSVLLYVDDEQPGFLQFRLPSCCPANPDDEISRLRVPKKIGWMVDDDYTDKEDAVVDEEAIEFGNQDKDDDDDNKGNNGSNNDDDGDNNYIEVVATTEKKRKKGRKSMSRKRHTPKGTANATKLDNTPINHDSVMLSGEGDADFEGDADAEDSDNDIDLFKEKQYEKKQQIG